MSSTTGGEGKIRQAIVEDDLVEAIVALPTQLFYTTGIPVCLWFLNRNKKQEGKTLFIDAREMGTMVSRKLRELTDDDINLIADTYNKTEEMPSLLAVGIYNRLYENTMKSYETVQHVENGDINPATGEPYEVWDIEPIMSVGPIEINGISTIKSVYKSMASNGRMGVGLGNRVSDGSKYMMEPDADGMVKATARVNSFKPYLGVGYGGRLLKGNDRLHIAVDLGAAFWGKPKIITHDGTDLIGDIQEGTISGKPGDYVKLVRKFHVLPVLEARLVYQIF